MAVHLDYKGFYQYYSHSVKSLQKMSKPTPHYFTQRKVEVAYSTAVGPRRVECTQMNDPAEVLTRFHFGMELF